MSEDAVLADSSLCISCVKRDPIEKIGDLHLRDVSMWHISPNLHDFPADYT